MNLLKEENYLKLYDNGWEMFSSDKVGLDQCIGTEAKVKNSLVAEGCRIHGIIENSVLFEGIYVGKNAIIKDSVIMPNVRIEDNVVINKAIVGSKVVIDTDCRVGDGKKITIIESEDI